MLAEGFLDHLDTLRQQSPFTDYRTVRDWVLRLKAQGTEGQSDPSAYWEEELAGFDYMLDASPLIIQTLRHHSFHLTGLAAYDYRSGKETRIPAIAAKMAMLEAAAGDRSLFVPESAAMGGFGFEIDGALVNIDTLKFWEVMIALEKAGILAGLRDEHTQSTTDRPLVLEIGAGWGGFARVFRTLLPGCRYAIVDLPETMLFSATYLKQLFPEARVYLHEPGTNPPDWSADFLFFAHTDLETLKPPRLDLALNMVSFQEMTGAQVSAYVDWAWSQGTSYLYSLNRERSVYNEEIDSVSERMETRFWIREFPILDLPYTRLPAPGTTHKQVKARDRGRKKAVDLKGDSGGKSAKERNAYRHLVGWRRMDG